MPTLAVLTAAGSGTRLGLDVPKALAELDGLPLVVHAARRLCASGVVDLVVVTSPPGVEAHVTALLAADPGVDRPVRVVTGAGTRQASVAAGLASGLADHLVADGTLPGPVDVVLVHDAARPLAPPSLVERVVRAVRAGHGAVVPGLPVTDTIKRVAPPAPDDPTAGGSAGAPAVEPVVATVDRSVLRAVQTPQGFDRALLERAHAAAAHRSDDEAVAATDDAGLVEDLGHPVHVVAGDAAAAKITTRRDLVVAGLTLEEPR
ncbi:IspD/TarI family cytidylyltransferase [Cellulosimicrobium marinum]|uniref:IspD/TarI family cytidylyltransferase n=1 Tax=Cellulosimicrobium marinum TaxID=1638992 RepID=UPI001E65AF04|nr:IspD/TarI family cytidylyltransferase [Cellulosimicrobium marinum]MCB7136892.1 2-C-methyl-D-erythritol 4-phosphate cytidylyltransferase [Cellulosimicrobium marinum]